MRPPSGSGGCSPGCGPSAIDVLRARTRALHHDIERKLSADRRSGDLAAYRQWLVGLLGLHRPLEAVLAGLPWPGEVDFPFRRKARLLERDLASLGLAPAAIASVPHCDRIPVPDSLPAGFGCLYVLEGSTLGGAVISKRVGIVLGITPADGGAYFAGYGPKRLMPMWRAFCAALEANCGDQVARHAAAEAAVATFGCFEYWLCGASPPSPDGRS